MLSSMRTLNISTPIILVIYLLAPVENNHVFQSQEKQRLLLKAMPIPLTQFGRKQIYYLVGTQLTTEMDNKQLA